LISISKASSPETELWKYRWESSEAHPNRASLAPQNSVSTDASSDLFFLLLKIGQIVHERIRDYSIFDVDRWIRGIGLSFGLMRPLSQDLRQRILQAREKVNGWAKSAGASA
jgi:hypothetical protein